MVGFLTKKKDKCLFFLREMFFFKNGKANGDISKEDRC
jgi:hypothetical protein